MRRLALMVVIAITLPAAARAQACRGYVSFARMPVRLGGGVVFGKDYTAYAASLVAGKENAAFGDSIDLVEMPAGAASGAAPRRTPLSATGLASLIGALAPRCQ